MFTLKADPCSVSTRIGDHFEGEYALLKEADRDIRSATIAALSSIKAEGIIPLLIEAEQGEANEKLRQVIRETIRELQMRS